MGVRDEYDSKENFKYCAENNVTPRIKIRIDSQVRYGHPARNKIVCEQLGRNKNSKISEISINKRKKNRDRWKKRVRYGQRWISKVVFSSFKRLFGSAVHSRKWENIVQEIQIKVHVYNLFCDIPTMA